MRKIELFKRGYATFQPFQLSFQHFHLERLWITILRNRFPQPMFLRGFYAKDFCKHPALRGHPLYKRGQGITNP
jgi:hypothetical protein